MPTLGEELKRRREARGITLNDISESTRIGTRFLKAIETDNYSVVPGGIYLRAFIRSFAKEVGMNEDEAIALYQQQVAGAAPELPPKPEGEKSKPSLIPFEEKPLRRPAPLSYARPTERNWSTIIIAAGIILFVVLIVVTLVRQFNKASVESDAQPTANQPAPAAPQPEQPPAQTPEAPAPSVPESNQITVQLAATTNENWVRYQVDGGELYQTILKPGQTLDVPPAQNEVKINFGDREGLKFKIKDRKSVV